MWGFAVVGLAAPRKEVVGDRTATGESWDSTPERPERA